jgi:hypothetical protein
MIKNSGNTEKLFIEIDTSELSQAQIRMLKTMNNLINHVLMTDNESEYFDGAAEAIRMCASLIKQANFVGEMDNSDIPYGQQVLEYSMDVLQDHMSQAKVVSYDN